MRLSDEIVNGYTGDEESDRLLSILIMNEMTIIKRCMKRYKKQIMSDLYNEYIQKSYKELYDEEQEKLQFILNKYPEFGV